ncbi:alpha-1,6 mannosyltransferase subunit (Mnn9), putative [Talaromyces stipitatus ATCC 10500]|uniref:Alpha-1,6 mannosyltransferase subunit (Mnn9), putative n=1 Tax=Talaromyces stipitatus (strain ATCC 10500 / CBS 375.48 / QM 6759 / NRRL 1006) TaxID=441959 RepID=B8M5B4_TALSN|nr:alpha-1,6 mannosyltransferase subunit (Mnn9), putative [Talaromyces stipitatus ATCC 10500]EED19720.1 alpha-1,6 mannosyltransferase subunit (Mnn9), putative [Talaromyces stipitatus ATCC 10500]
MALSRSLRRTNSITLVLALVLAIGFIFFLFDPTSSSTPITAQQRQEDAASHPLSPPTKPFPKKHTQGRKGQDAPPPVVHYRMNELTASDSAAERGERVLILTPMMSFYQQYWDNLVKLTYPHELISLGFILPKTNKGNAATLALQEAVSKTQSGPIDDRFASVTILRQDFDPPLQSQDEKERHKKENQKIRREAMSRARNSLLFTTLGPSTSWVLWLDSDIVETPTTLIEDLTSHNKPVIVPNCYQRYFNSEAQKMDVRAYDYNSWVESDIALNLAAEMGPDDVLFEGYADIPTYRSLMVWMLPENSEDLDPRAEVELDGVGGTALMVKADVHRDGAMFPPFPFYHLLETEGFAKMAKRLGYTCWGLPHYFVYHYNE